MTHNCPITTHVLDTRLGKPAADIDVVLEIQESAGQWRELGRGTTNGDGRIGNLLTDEELSAGIYRLTFHTAAYFQATGTAAFYPSVCVTFQVERTDEHYHVPLLLSPFGYSTYRGS